MFDHIQSDPDVCSNCFRRTHDRFERNYRLETYFNDEEGEWDVRPVKVQGIKITVEVDGTKEGNKEQVIGGKPDAVYRKGENTIKIPERGGHRGLVTVCECGYRWAPQHEMEEWKNRPLNKRTFFNYAENLLERAREAAESIDEDEFMDRLDELKSDPDRQFADDRIFREALDSAIRVEQVRQ